jgi:hypothetical protein
LRRRSEDAGPRRGPADRQLATAETADLVENYPEQMKRLGLGPRHR